MSIRLPTSTSISGMTFGMMDRPQIVCHRRIADERENRAAAEGIFAIVLHLFQFDAGNGFE
jgi:hypothetical protein